MRILHNPLLTGSDIKNVVYQGLKLDNHPKGELRQYPDHIASFISGIYEFLKEVTPEEAQKILNTPKLEYQCEHCDFATDTKIALLGHKRKHKEEKAKAAQPAFDTNLIPVVSGQQIASLDTPLSVDDTKNGLDKDGVPWYGEGLVEENKSFEAIKPQGQAHFGGESLYDS